MSRIRPLSYIEPSGGTVTPGSVLTLARGLIGQWNAPVAEAVLDTEGTPLSVADIARAYNQLVWDFSRLGIVTTVPRMWFGEAGFGGIAFLVNGMPVFPYYTPYQAPNEANTLALSDVLDDMNNLIGSDNAVLSYSGGRVQLIINPSKSLLFGTPDTNTNYMSALRIMRRLFNRTDIDIYYSGPKVITGNPLAGPIAGIYPVPNNVTDIYGTDTIDGFSISWTPVSQPAGITTVQYVVYAALDGDTPIEVGTTSDTSILTTQLLPGNTYLVSVITFTDYEVSEGQQLVPLTPTGGPPPPVNYKLYTNSQTILINHTEFSIIPESATMVTLNCKMKGAGGGGGGGLGTSDPNNSSARVGGGGGGGGSGDEVILYSTTVPYNTEFVLTIGAGGAGGSGAQDTSAASNGSNGGNTDVVANYLINSVPQTITMNVSGAGGGIGGTNTSTPSPGGIGLVNGDPGSAVASGPSYMGGDESVGYRGLVPGGKGGEFYGGLGGMGIVEISSGDPDIPPYVIGGPGEPAPAYDSMNGGQGFIYPNSQSNYLFGCGGGGGGGGAGSFGQNGGIGSSGYFEINIDSWS